ncbi:MAG: hypothetical protein EBZ74_05445 [Planctomycetia bacterium]|nr:hypothetical protein [Planctomycetia bacterium]
MQPIRSCPTSVEPAARWRGLAACAVAAVAAACPAAEAHAQGGWLPTAWFAPAELPSDAMFPLAEKDGPWLVLATTFRGEGARDDARRLVQELRRDHKLKAYTHEKSFDYTGRQQGLGLNPDGSPKTMRYANAAQVTEVAVLVGDFASFDDPRGQKMLATVKRLQPRALAGEAGKTRAYSDFRKMIGLGGAAKGPMHMAFVIPNPLLPEDFFARQEVDRFVVEMNADVTHSLLDCPGRYTVRVATFTGAGTVDQKAITGSDDFKLESRLADAADKAHRLTEALRRAGWQAWEFHDRESSIVCVGSLDQLAVPQESGPPAAHPEIGRIVRELGPDAEKLAAGTVMPRAIDGILLDVKPKPIDVPRAPGGWR